MKWGDMNIREQLEWTKAFLDHPPVFLGVIGMLGTQAGWKNGKPVTLSLWTREAELLSEGGCTPQAYALVRKRIPELKREAKRRLMHAEVERKLDRLDNLDS